METLCVTAASSVVSPRMGWHRGLSKWNLIALDISIESIGLFCSSSMCFGNSTVLNQCWPVGHRIAES